jgi:hypothetical protein
LRQSEMAQTEKEKWGKTRGHSIRTKIRILTETKEEEKKKGSDEHGPELYAGVEEREGPSES